MCKYRWYISKYSNFSVIAKFPDRTILGENFWKVGTSLDDVIFLDTRISIDVLID